VKNELKLITELNPAEYNPRKISAKDFEDLKNSLKEFGSVQAAVINSDGTIIGGHQRIKAAAALGWVDFPCYVVDLPKDKEKELNLLLNKVSGEFDNSKLAALLADLAGGEARNVAGFSSDDVKNIMARADLAGRTAALAEKFKTEPEFQEAANNAEKIIQKLTNRIRKLADEAPEKLNRAFFVAVPLRRGQECFILADPNADDAAQEIRRLAEQGIASPLEGLLEGLL